MDGIAVIKANPGSINRLIYGQKPIEFTNYIQNQFARLESIIPMGSDLGRSFLENSKKIFNDVVKSNAASNVRSLINKFGFLGQEDEIRLMGSDNISDFQQAPLTMQRWLMAFPDIRELANKQQIYAWADTLQDPTPFSVSGEDHYEYRRLMDHIVQEQPKDPNEWMAVTYAEDLKPGDKPLEFCEQVMLFTAHDIFKNWIALGDEDPSDPSGGKL